MSQKGRNRISSLSIRVSRHWISRILPRRSSSYMQKMMRRCHIKMEKHLQKKSVQNSSLQKQAIMHFADSFRLLLDLQNMVSRLYVFLKFSMSGWTRVLCHMHRCTIHSRIKMLCKPASQQTSSRNTSVKSVHGSM